MRHSISGSTSLPAALAMSALTLSTLLTAVPSYAQSTATSPAPVTRAQVKAELEELMDAGYYPSEGYNYSDNLRAAERIVQQRHEALAQADKGTAAPDPSKAATDQSKAATGQNESVSGVAGRTSEAGAPARDQGALRSGGAYCVDGPKCSLYFGR